MPVVTSRAPPGADCCDSIRVKVKDSRRKQQWVDPLPTPPRSPTTTDLPESEPIMDDLWELWTGAGLHELAAEQDFTIDSALNELGFTDEDLKHCHSGSNSDDDEMDEGLFGSINSLPFTPGDMVPNAEETEELLNHLLHYVQDNSPPPTNPPSPPEPEDYADNEDSEPEPYETKFSHSSTFINNSSGFSSSNCSGSSNSSMNGDSSPGYDESNFLGESSSTEENSPIYEEGLIGEDLINDTPDIFDTPFDSLMDSKLNFFTEDFEKEIKHDCMWAGEEAFSIKEDSDIAPVVSTELKQTPKFDFSKIKIKTEPIDDIDIVEHTNSTHVKEEILQDDDDEMNWASDPYGMWTEDTPPGSSTPSSTSSSAEDNSEEPVKLDWKERVEEMTVDTEAEELEFRRSATLNDHSYANPLIHENKFSRDLLSSRRSNAIQGIVIKEENGDDYSGGPKKTKILVPLKDLMDSLQHKTFLVAPLGPGKKVIRLTGTETVKGMLGVQHYTTSSALRSVSSYCVPQQSLYNRSHLPLTSNHQRLKKAKTNRSIIREGGTITFPQQSPTPSSSSLSSLSSSSGTTASGRPKKTKTHNNMERMRRIDLRNSFDSLKKLVPPLCKSTKCSKVEILRRAEEYIRNLKSVEKRLLREEALLRSRNDALKLKVLHSQQQPNA